MSQLIGGNLQVFNHLCVPFENLDCVPTLLLGGHIVEHGLFNVGQCVLNGAFKYVGGLEFLSGAGNGCGFVGSLFDTVAFQCGDFHGLAAQFFFQLI